jgi:hypothetical protein
LESITDYIYVVSIKRFVHLLTLREYDHEQFNPLHAADWRRGKDFFSASSHFLKQRRGKRVHDVTFRPGDGRLVSDPSGGQLLNVYSPSSLEPTHGDVSTWLELAAHVIPDEAVRRHIFDWCACLLQKPGVKCNHGLLITGGQGIGKDSFFKPVLDAVGSHNVVTVGPQDLDLPYNDYLYRKRLIVVEEIRALHDRALANRLKAWLASPPEMIPISRKYTPTFSIPNIVSFLFFSNVDAPLAISDDDRRLFVYRSPVSKRSDAYYVGYHKWADHHAGDVYGYLLDRDISKWNPKAHPPATESKAELIEASRSPLYQFFEASIAAKEYPLEDDLVSVNDLAKQIHARFGRPSNHRIGATLRELGAV